MRKVFEKYCDKEKQEIVSRQALEDALKELDVCYEDVNVVWKRADHNENGTIDYAEFMKLASEPSAAEMWARGIPLWQPLADALPQGQSLEMICGLTGTELERILEAACTESKKLIREAHQVLKKSLVRAKSVSSSHHNNNGSKFSTFKASAGTVKDYHGSVVERTGNFSVA